MKVDENAKPANQGNSVFTSESQVREVRAGNMSMIIGTSDICIEQFKDDIPEECDYPEVPDGASSEYDTWLG